MDNVQYADLSMNQILVKLNVFLNAKMELYYKKKCVMMVIEFNLMDVINAQKVVKLNAYYVLIISVLKVNIFGTFKSINVYKFVEMGNQQSFLMNNAMILKTLIFLIVNITVRITAQFLFRFVCHLFR
ncbi:unnamed protein product [Paramecium sonneborni]|uniref:Transmembrane protein n=1 Tax=Paramecium sonneborni TaxID=65129 RepID=A0A8S1R8S8_9CILI|nr:unnamed protein product [Paramecium sonneborni]